MMNLYFSNSSSVGFFQGVIDPSNAPKLFSSHAYSRIILVAGWSLHVRTFVQSCV